MLDNITQLVMYFLTVSIAAERLTEIFKRTIIKDSTTIPKFSGAIYQIIAGVFGTIVAYISPPHLEFLQINQYVMYLLTGLAVSGGSGAWNSILEFLKEAATIKAKEAK